MFNEEKTQEQTKENFGAPAVTQKQGNVPQKSLPIGDDNLPDYLRSSEELGSEDISIDEVVTPRIKIVQGQSNIKDINKDIRDGEFYNSSTGESYGEKIDVYVLFKWNSVVWFDDKFNFIGSRHIDKYTGEDIRIGDIDFDNPEIQEAGTDCYNYMIALCDDIKKAAQMGIVPDIFIYSAGSAAQGPARNLNGKIRSNGNKKVPIYGQRVSISTIKKTFKKGSAFMPVFSFPGFPTEDELKVLSALYPQCKKMYSKSSTHIEENETKAEQTYEVPEFSGKPENIVPQEEPVPSSSGEENPFEM